MFNMTVEKMKSCERNLSEGKQLRIARRKKDKEIGRQKFEWNRQRVKLEAAIFADFC